MSGSLRTGGSGERRTRRLRRSGRAPPQGAVPLAAQAQEPAAVRVDQEPNHKVVFKNDYVRVIDATFPPGHVTLNHSHALDNVAVAISTGRDTAPGRAYFAKGGYSHRVTNSGTGVMRFIDVEILKSDRPGAAATSLPHHTLEDDSDFEFVENVDGKVTTTSRSVGAPDGKTRTLTVTGTNAQGQTVKNVVLWEKQ